MKHIFRLVMLSSLLVAALAACKKDEYKDYLKGGTNPVLTSSVSSTNLPLSYANRNSEALKLTWTNPNYQFSTGISSQDVSYLIEIDTTGANFTSPKRQSIAVSKDLSRSFTQGELNGYLLNQLILDTSVSHNIEFRVTAYLTNNSAKISSNVLKYVVIPYSIPPVVTPPANGNLYLVGSATAGGWNNPVPTPSQQFKKISNTLYEITIPLTGGQEYLFLPLNGDWNNKYAVADNTLSGLSDGGDFGFNLAKNFPGPAASGTYKITVDFQRGKFTVTKQ